MNQRPTGLSLISLLLLMLLTGIAPQGAWAGPLFSSSGSGQRQGEPDFGSALYRESFNDLQVKVLGGTLRATRQWQDTQWVFFPEWLDLTFDYEKAPVTQEGAQAAPEENPKTIKRGVFEYHKIAGGGENSTLYRFDENKRITRTTTGHVWSDRRGNEIHYDIDGKLYQIQNRYGVKSTFTRDAQGRLYQVKDHHGEIRLTIRYNTFGQVSEVEDYSGRKVTYSWSGTTLQSVTDTRGQEWKYQYQTLLNKTVMQKKISPEGRETLIEHTVIPGGVKCIPTERQPGAGIFTVTADGEGSSLKQGCTSVTVPDTLVLQAIKDQDGIGISYDYFYDAVKKLYTLIEKHPSGRVVENVINLNGETTERYENDRLMSKTLTEGRKRTTTLETATQYIREFDDWNNLIRLYYPDGRFVSFTYTDLGDVKTHIDLNGLKTEFVYEDSKLIRQIEAKGTTLERSVEYRHDVYGNVTQYTLSGDANIAAATYLLTYDTLGNLGSFTDAEGHLTQYLDYNAMGIATRVIDAKGHEWRYKFDAEGNLLQTWSPLGWAAETKYGPVIEYDKDGWLVSTKTSMGESAFYSYDTQGRSKSVKDPNGNLWVLERNLAGQVVRSIDPLNKKTELSYDLFGRLVRQVDGRQNAIEFHYANDASKPFYLPDSVQYPTFKRTYEYNSQQLVARMTDSAVGMDPYVAELTYAKNGALKTEKDADGRVTEHQYDLLGRLVSSMDANFNYTRYEYDIRDNLIALTDPAGSATRFGYDRDGRKIYEARPMGQRLTYFWNSLGQLQWMTDPNNNKVIYLYDNDGRQTDQITYVAGSWQSPEQVVTYQYNHNNQLVSYSNGTLSSTYEYTPNAELKKETVDFGPFSKSYVYSYYENGDLKTWTDPEGRTQEYHYDTNRQLESVTIPNVGIYSVSDYKWFQPTEITYPGGTQRTQQFNSAMQLTDISVKDPGQNLQMNYHYAYDKALNVKSKDTEHGQYIFQYDKLNRLIAAQNPNTETETFTYDAVGNRKTTQESVEPWAYNANHQLLNRPEVNYSYDANGATTKITKDAKDRHLQYNASSRLTEIKDHNNQSIAKYQYDPLGRRISKEVNGEKIYFLYSPQGLIGEYTATGQLIRGYGYKPDGTWMTDPLYLKTGNTREQHYFYQNDVLGTPQKLVSTTGAIVWNARYESFGKYTSAPLEATAHSVENPLRFAGQYEDKETGWHYNWQRYYAPELGRYITEDSAGFIGGVNFYAYAVGNPTGWIDPEGDVAHIVAGAVIGGALGGVIALIQGKNVWSGIGYGALSGGVVAATMGIAGPALGGGFFGVVGGGIISSGASNISIQLAEILFGERCQFSGDELVTEMLIGGATAGILAKIPFGKLKGLFKKKAKAPVFIDACFVAGTQIRTVDGVRNIEDIKVDDKVWSRNDQTGEMGYKKVLNTFITRPTELIHLTYVKTNHHYQKKLGERGEKGQQRSAAGEKSQSGDAEPEPEPDYEQELIGTKNHPFWSVNRNAWVELGGLETGDILLLDDGTEAQVIGIELETAEKGSYFTTYNFEVEDWHTYFVAPINTEVGANSVWVHNAGANPCAVTVAPNKGVPLINGRKPINSQYAGGTHPSGVKFNEQGFPDFTPYSKAQVDIKGLTGNYAKDSAMANKAVGLKSTPEGYVWHHVENGKSMQLIPKDVHNAARHTGGAAILRNQ